ncbi:TetR/AcrR family transcriptional regulator [Chitinophaga japonensis]|uniref:TetR family transcriptional regulator n=1 Tax=Chitinophaga japonensis TaxID=104662 RepID=A0A562T6G5_CHIJA|nr:TetR/AcrR family transcriptional regulator [Chitinophaga japonensis]TWI89082.1 TetR family transcriptional regulator [Chitinophaga japonensis]
MGIADRKEREKLEMKRLIMEAAMRMFVEEGYEKTSIRNIADKIEYSPATIYLYYKDKDDLLYDVQGQAFEQLLRTFREKAVSKSPLKKLEQISKAYVQFGLEHPDLYDLMFIIRAPMNKVEKEEAWLNGEGCFQFLLDCLEDCTAQKLLRFRDKMVAALSIWSMVHGLVALNVRCRFKVMKMEEDGVRHAIDTAIEDYLKMIKN